MATVSLAAAGPEAGARRRRSGLGIVLVLCAIAGAGAARGDLWVREKITGADGKALGERIWTSTAGKVRMDEGASGILVDATSGHGWIWGWGEERCLELPLPAGPQSAVPASAAATRLPMIVQDLRGRGVVAPRATQTKIAGLDARRYDVVDGADVIQERWLASSLPNADFDQLVHDWTASGRLNVWLGVEETRIAIQTSGLGYPVRVVDHRTGITVEAVEYRTTAQPPSAFTPPQGCAGR
jgi:hypothetical protein